MTEPIGIIAGGGLLPILEARGIRAAGRPVACVGLSSACDPGMRELCDRFATAGTLQIGRWIRLLRRWQVRQAVMVGAVRKAQMYEPLKWIRQLPDLRAGMLWYRVLRHDRRDQAVLTAVANELARHGIELIDTTQYIADQLASAGPMSVRRLGPKQQADLDFGWPLLMRIGEMDIGQAIAVKDRDVIAVEAMEGTDEMIERAGQLCPIGGWMLLKGPPPDKDMRFDVPTVGVHTIENLKRAGASALAVRSQRVILADRTELLTAADAAGIAVVGV